LHVPAVKPNQRWAFDELARRRGDYAIVGAGVIASFDGGKISDARIVFISVGSTPVRAKAAEAALTGNALDAAAIQRAQAALETDLDPPGDKHMTATMRMHLARVLLGRLLHRVMEAA